jgi:hypothetical protein
MSNPAKQIVLGAALLVGTTMVTNADPLPRTGDKSTASGAARRGPESSGRLARCQTAANVVNRPRAADDFAAI